LINTAWHSPTASPAYYVAGQPRDNNPIDPAPSARIFAGVLVEDDCWNDFGTPFAQLSELRC
jgi:hypothetical protein